MSGYALGSNDTMIHDKLEAEDSKVPIEYIMAHYKVAMNNRVVSGQHKPFSDFVLGKHWLHYLNIRLRVIGDAALNDCCYFELSDDVKIIGTNQSRYRSTTPSSDSKRQRINKI